MDILRPGGPETLRKTGSSGWILTKGRGVFLGPMLAASLFKVVKSKSWWSEGQNIDSCWSSAWLLTAGRPARPTLLSGQPPRQGQFPAACFSLLSAP